MGPFYVSVKHGDTMRHMSIVSALLDIFECYVNERTGIVVAGENLRVARRIRGPRR